MSASLQFSCLDKIGLFAALANHFVERNVKISQHEEIISGEQFFSRIEWVLDDRWENEDQFSAEFDDLAKKYTATFNVQFNTNARTIGLLVSSHTRSLSELLNKFEDSFYNNDEISFIIGNDDSIRKIADRHAIPFFYIPSTLDPLKYEEKQLEIIKRYKPNYLGLSSDAATLSANFLQNVSCPIIGVRNSYLSVSQVPKTAFDRGVKLIGATAYFVTPELGNEPIIEQDTARIGSGVSLQEFINTGHIVEQRVFAQALSDVLQHKVMVYQNQTFVFN